MCQYVHGVPTVPKRSNGWARPSTSLVEREGEGSIAKAIDRQVLIQWEIRAGHPSWASRALGLMCIGASSGLSCRAFRWRGSLRCKIVGFPARNAFQQPFPEGHGPIVDP